VLLAERAVELDPPELRAEPADPSLKLLSGRRPDRERDCASKQWRPIGSAQSTL
jgi:hypothetical protein